MKILILILSFVGLLGCESLQNISPEGEMAIQYGTVKLIKEIDSVDPDQVLDFVSRVKPLVSDDVDTIEEAMNIIRAQIDFASFQPEDRLLINWLFDYATSYLQEKNLLPSEVKGSAEKVLTWIEQAAIYAQ